MVTAALFAVLFRYLPDVRISWGDVGLGAGVTAVLFKIGQYLQALYFTYISTGSAEAISPMPKAADGVAGVRIASTPEA